MRTKQRIPSLDLLRGIALLGILIMNISSFSQIGIAYLNPNLGAGLEDSNRWIWDLTWIFANVKFMSIFSILFGAGMLLFYQNMKAKDLHPGVYHYKRMFFLLIAGLIHAHFIWMGDILVAYAICGGFVYLFRNASNRVLWILGSILFVIPVLLNLANYSYTPPSILEEIYSFFSPDPAIIQKEYDAYTGSYMDQLPVRSEAAIEMETLIFLLEMFWRASAMMLLGMIFYRKGILSAEKSRSFYIKLAVFGIVVGTIISGTGLYRAHQLDWPNVWTMTVGNGYNYIGSVFTAMGYIGLIMLLSKSGILQGVKKALRAVGRMAFTNYILTSIICTFIFYGHGLGYYEKLDRAEQMFVVLLVWVVLIIFSNLWLSKFKQGPLELVWRKWTYSNLTG